MLICKNCYSENPDGTIKCHQCNMEGNFIHKTSEVTTGPVWKVESTVNCQNCGTEQPGGGTTCAQCNFPLPQKQKKNTDGPISYQHLKTG